MDTKPQLKQVTNYLGAVVGVVGNLLPLMTPDFLTACGVSPATAHIASTVAATLLFAYQEKKPAAVAVPPVTPPSESPK